MLHVRKTPTVQEELEYQEWLAKHKQVGKNNTQKLTKTGPITQANTFWADRAKETRRNIEMHRGGHESANSVDTKVTGAVALKQRKMIVEHLDLDREQIEALKARDDIAGQKLAEKMNRLAPAYNKGPLILYSEEDVETSLKTGANRRRN